jgi:carboxylesterase
MTIKDLSTLYEGNRTGVLLIHGLGGTPVEMKTVAKRLNNAGHTVLCCQLAGHCGTEFDLAATHWQDWYASAEAALERLEERCDTIVVGGLSMGGLLAAKLAAAEPSRVKGLVILAPTLWYDGWTIPWYAVLLKLLRNSISLPVLKHWSFAEREPYGIKDERVRKIILQAMTSGDSTLAGVLRTPAYALRELWRLVDALKPELPKVRQRALVIQAREDDIASLRNAQYLQRHLGGLVETLILDDSYHLVTVDQQRHVVNDRVVSFVGAIAKAAKPVQVLQPAQPAQTPVTIHAA